MTCPLCHDRGQRMKHPTEAGWVKVDGPWWRLPDGKQHRFNPEDRELLLRPCECREAAS